MRRALGMVLGCVVAVRVEAAQDPGWTADSGLGPTEAIPSWVLVDTAPTDPILFSNRLELITSSALENLYYSLEDPAVEPSTNLVVEARMQLLPGSSSGETRGPAGLVFAPTGGVGNALWIADGEIFVDLDEGTKGPSAAVSTTNAPHTYRVEVQGWTSGSPFTVYYDGSPVLTGAVFNSVAFNGDKARAGWGEISSEEYGGSRWMEVKYNGGSWLQPVFTRLSAHGLTAGISVSNLLTGTTNALETASTLGDPDGWTWVTNIFSATGATNVEDVAATGPGRFYRIRRP